MPRSATLQPGRQGGFVVATLLGCATIGLSCLAEESARLGIVSERPSEGHFVECAEGYMVAYTDRIPGTDVTFEMVPIPGGEFLLGSPEGEADAQPHEQPQLRVRVAPCWMGKHEVTWAEYQSFMRMYDKLKELQANQQRVVTAENEVDAVTVPTPLYDPSYTYALGEDARQPAVTMSQYAAKQYTEWLSRLTERFYRLPSEAEWEYACRAGSKTAYFFGDDPADLDDYAWYFDNSDDATHHVGQKKANPWGLHDVHGNVAELTLDQYRETHYADLAPRARNGGLPAPDAIAWPTDPLQRVIRGGGWESDPDGLRSAARAATQDWRIEDPNLPKSPWWFTDEEALAVGFRILRPLEEIPLEQRRIFWDADDARLKSAVANRMAEGRGVQGTVDPELAEELQRDNR